MDPKANKLFQIQEKLLNIGNADFSTVTMEGLSFHDAIRLVAMFHRVNRMHNSILNEMSSMLKYKETGYEKEEWPVL